MLEIERKFLVSSDTYKLEAYDQQEVDQGYLNSHPERTVRIRTKGAKAFLTVKGRSTDGGTSRFEWEREISVKEAKELLDLCEPGRIQKMRFLVKSGKHIFEVDEFYGDNAGLVVAEVELSQSDEVFERPDWLGEEVTGKREYYNSHLSKNPYNKWNNS